MTFNLGQKVRLPEWFGTSREGWIIGQPLLPFQQKIYYVGLPLTSYWGREACTLRNYNVFLLGFQQFSIGVFHQTELALMEEEYQL